MLSQAIGLPFRAMSYLRGASAFHPSGVVFDASLTRIAAPGVGLPVESSTVLARLSKGVGTPSGIPDVGGLALRLPPVDDGPEWDILLAGARSGTVGRIIPWPALSWNTVEFSSLMPLAVDGDKWWLRARITSPLGAGMDLGSPRDAVAGPGVRIALDQARGSGPFELLAVVKSMALRDDIDEHPAFDPVINTPTSVRPQPEWLRRIRVSAYENSRAGRPEADPFPPTSR